MAAVSEVSRIQFNTKLKLASDNRAYPYKGTAAGETRAAAGGSFNDPGYGDQWHFNNNGDRKFAETTRAGADINVEEAWRLSAGDPSLIVAIVDQGIKYTHPDLAANMWINRAEQNGSAGRDDDGNGYADDVYGYNFALGTGQLTWDVDVYNSKGENIGDSGHGTHVAGTVAAVNNNAIRRGGHSGRNGQQRRRETHVVPDIFGRQRRVGSRFGGGDPVRCRQRGVDPPVFVGLSGRSDHHRQRLHQRSPDRKTGDRLLHCNQKQRRAGSAVMKSSRTTAFRIL